MSDIIHDFPVAAAAPAVFEAISTPDGLDTWWTKTSAGAAEEGAQWTLGFGDGYSWSAIVRRFEQDREIEWELTDAHEDWVGTRVALRLREHDGTTAVEFRHRGWSSDNAHYRTSCYCWAMYLRLLKRHVEHGETVPYEQRLDV